MSDAKAADTKREVVAPPDAGLAGSASGDDALGLYLARLKGRSCVLPLQIVWKLIGGSLPGTGTSAEWWTDAEGWPASPAAAACQSAGWQLHSSATRVGGARRGEVTSAPRAGFRPGD